MRWFGTFWPFNVTSRAAGWYHRGAELCGGQTNTERVVGVSAGEAQLSLVAPTVVSHRTCIPGAPLRTNYGSTPVIAHARGRGQLEPIGQDGRYPPVSRR